MFDLQKEPVNNSSVKPFAAAKFHMQIQTFRTQWGYHAIIKLQRYKTSSSCDLWTLSKKNETSDRRMLHQLGWIGLDSNRLKSFHPQEASLKGDSPSVTSPAPERIPSTTSQENCWTYFDTTYLDKPIRHVIQNDHKKCFSNLGPLDQRRRDGVRFNIFQWLWAVNSDCGAEIASKLGNIAIALLQQKCFSWSSYACRSVILAGNGGLPDMGEMLMQASAA